MDVRRLLATVVAGAVGVTVAPTIAAGSALAAPVAPKGLTVTRAADDVHQVRVAWRSMPGVENYKVDIIQGEERTIKVLPADATGYTIEAPDPCVSYKVRVGSVDAQGAESYTGYTFAKSLAPGAVMGMRTGREAEGTIGTASWREPAWPGYTPLTGYHTQLIRLIDGAILLDEFNKQTSYQFPDMEPGRAYVLKVSTHNEFGTCLTAKSLIDRFRPADPVSLIATRRPDKPATVDVTWKPSPDNPDPTYFQLSYGVDKPSKTVRVDAPETSTELSLDPAQSGVVQLKSYNENGGSGAITASLSPAIDPEPALVRDTTPPTITATTSGQRGAGGWHTGPVTVTFACADGQSDVVSCSSPVTLTADGREQTVTGTATDAAGNSASTSVTVNIDQTAPTITATVIGAKNAAGWYRTPPTIHYTCDDKVSTLVSCPAEVQVGDSGENQTFSATATDDAGNTASVTVGGINVDLVAPAVRVAGAASGAVYGLDELPEVSCDTTDAVSGVAVEAALSSGRDERGTYTVSCAGGTDVAGNSAAPATIRYQVRPTVSSLTALTFRYLGGDATNGIRTDLGNKLNHGQTALYIAKVLKEASGKKPALSTEEADELIYWVRVLIEQS